MHSGWVGLGMSDNGGNEEDQVNAADPLWFSMAPHWTTIRACVDGNEYLKQHADVYLPQQPMELQESWQGRVSAVFSPYLQKILRVAVGLILRGPSTLKAVMRLTGRNGGRTCAAMDPLTWISSPTTCCFMRWPMATAIFWGLPRYQRNSH